MAKKNVIGGTSVRYHKLSKTEDGFVDLQPTHHDDDEENPVLHELPEASCCPMSCFLPSPKPLHLSNVGLYIILIGMFLFSAVKGSIVGVIFKKPESKVPWKAITLAVFLFIVGTCLIVFASLLFSGHISGKHSEGAWPLLILGSLMFIPGIYHVRIAYYAYKKYPGYSFDDIPDFD